MQSSGGRVGPTESMYDLLQGAKAVFNHGEVARRAPSPCRRLPDITVCICSMKPAGAAAGRHSLGL